MENNVNYDKQYFDNLMERGAEQGADPTLMADAKKAFKFVEPGLLKKLMVSSPEEFYKNYAEVICSAVLDARTNGGAFSRFMTKAKFHEGHEAEEHGFFYNALRYVAATLLGLVKFAWDVLFIGGAFGVRFGVRLGKNLMHAVTKTVIETGADAKYAGLTLKESFDRNILGKVAVKTDEKAVMEVMVAHDVAVETINAVSLTVE